MHARVLKFHICIPRDKIADTYFPVRIMPLSWVMALLKIFEWNLVSKMSKKTIKARALKVNECIASNDWMSWLTFEEIPTNTSWVMALGKFGHLYIACFVMHSLTLEPCTLGFWNFIYRFHMKNSWYIFFSCQDYAPFLSCGLLKNIWMKSCQHNFSKIIKLEPWKLMSALRVMSRWPD